MAILNAGVYRAVVGRGVYNTGMPMAPMCPMRFSWEWESLS